MDKRVARLSLTETQKRVLLDMLGGSRLTVSDNGKWEIGDPPVRVRSATVDSLLSKGGIRLGVGHCVPTTAGAEAVGRMTLDMAIRAAAEEAPDEYARQYAETAMRAADEGGTHGLESQVRYILANLGTWRSKRGRIAKAAMTTWLEGRKGRG